MTLQHMSDQFIQETLRSLYEGTDQIMGVHFKHAQSHHLNIRDEYSQSIIILWGKSSRM